MNVLVVAAVFTAPEAGNQVGRVPGTIPSEPVTGVAAVVVPDDATGDVDVLGPAPPPQADSAMQLAPLKAEPRKFLLSTPNSN